MHDEQENIERVRPTHDLDMLELAHTVGLAHGRLQGVAPVRSAASWSAHLCPDCAMPSATPHILLSPRASKETGICDTACCQNDRGDSQDTPSVDACRVENHRIVS